jgi:two-component system sensor histidine kinase ChiS
VFFRRVTILAITVLLMYLFTSAEEYKLEHVSLEQGISHNLIYSIFQDSKGLMWFGTMYGLVKYDGNTYTVYRYDPMDSNSLSNDNIISIYEDNEGYLWFGTYKGGLNQYDRRTGIFKRYIHDPNNPNSICNNIVWAVLEDKNKDYWIGTGAGLDKLVNQQFIHFTSDSLNPEKLSSNLVYNICEDKTGNLWLGTFGGGLNKLDVNKGTFKRYVNDNSDSNSLSGNFIRSMFRDRKGNLWIGTYGRGMNKFVEEKDNFLHYLHNPSDKSSISNNDVNYIIEDEKDNLWIGLNGGVDRFDKLSFSFEHFKIENENDDNEQNCIAVFEDRSGIIWLGSYYGGLYKFYKKHNDFNTFRHSISDIFSLSNNYVRSIFEDKSGKIWIGTNYGLNKFDEEKQVFKQFKYDSTNKNGLSNNWINSIVEDNDRNLWIGTTNGLDRFDRKKNSFAHYRHEKENINSISSNVILSLFVDKTGTLWVGTNSGLNRFDKKKNEFKRFVNIPSDQNSLSDNLVYTIYEDKKGLIWIGTYGGLNRLDESKERFTRYVTDPHNSNTINNNYVHAICEDMANNFWIGTAGGLNLFDRDKNIFTHYSEKDGLPNSVVCGILEDEKGFLWISTNKGLSKFDFKNKIFKNYETDDGLQSNMFVDGAYCRLGNGEFAFGGINGFNIFKPSAITESQFIPSIVLTSLTKFDGPQKKEIDISDIKELTLSYKDNPITISFASLDFTKPSKNQYSYMLEGIDEDWIRSGNFTKAVYANLSPGKYVFKVKGTNSDGVWNEQIASIKLIIAPPFWNTWWFYSLIAAAVLIMIVVIQNYRIKNKLKNLLEIERAKSNEREAVREQASRDYHDELGHKLTRIALYSRRIKKNASSETERLKDDLDSIIETSINLQSSAKDIIWTLDPEEDTLYDAAVRLKDFGNEIFENTGIRFEMGEIPDRLRNLKLDMNYKRHIIYIFKEGMNNILKYAECKKVRFEICENDSELCMTLNDDGKGFMINGQSKGYGLKNMLKRAEQMGARIEIESIPNQGTRISLHSQI